MGLARRIGNLFRRSQVDREIDAEMEAHIALRTEENIARGMTPQEARRDARVRFGNPSVMKEKATGADAALGLENLWFDVRYALRQMRRAPGFAFTVILTLTLGIGATTAMFTLIDATLLRTLPYPEADRIVRVHDVRLQGHSTAGLVGVPRFFDLAERSKSFASVGFFYFDDTTLIDGARLPVAIEGAGTNAAFWKVFGVRPLLGRVFDEQDNTPNAPMVAVLSYGTWQRIFGGDPGVIGRQVTIEQKSTTVIGVMPKEFSVPSGIDLWRPAQFTPGDWKWRGEGTRFLNVAARLALGVSLDAARDDLRRIGEQLRHEHAETDAPWQFDIAAMREELYGELKPALLVLFTASSFLLFVACINVANLLLARAATREREVVLRRALGAPESRIRLQFLTEAALLALTGGCAGLALTFALVRMLAARLPGRLGAPGMVEMDWRVAWFSFALAVACGIGFGLAPALCSRRAGLNAALKQREMRIAGAGRGWTRNAFIAAQVAVSLVLLVGASLLGESLWNLLKSPLGFAPEHLLTFRIVLPWNAESAAIREFYANTQRRVEALPGVIAVGQISALPTEQWESRDSFNADWLPRAAHSDAANAEVRSVSGNFLRALGMPLLAGRELVAGDGMKKLVPVLVNRSFVQQYMPGGNPIGRHLSNDNGSMEIVGILGDVRGTAGSISSKVGPEIYLSADGVNPNTRRSFVVRSQLSPEQLVASIREQVHQADPQQAIANVATMEELLDRSIAQPRLNAALITAFAGITLLLACVGIYSVVAWSVAQRVQEIGVRMAMGATRTQISLLFMRRAAWATGIGLAAGTGVALMLTQMLRSQLYGVGPSDPVIYLVSMLALLAPVMMATLRPALAAASVDPVEALRAE